MCILWNHMPHPSLGILNIPLVAGNEVKMDMKDTLPGRGPNIDTDVVAIRMKLRVDVFFFLIDECHAGRHLLRHQVEKAGDMPTRDDQGVPRARRIGVSRAEGKLVL